MRIVSDIAVFVLKCDIKLQPPTNLGREKRTEVDMGRSAAITFLKFKHNHFVDGGIAYSCCFVMDASVVQLEQSVRYVCVSVCMCGQYLLN